jgi:hypothetical protein
MVRVAGSGSVEVEDALRCGRPPASWIWARIVMGGPKAGPVEVTP